MRAAGIAADMVPAWHGHTERMTHDRFTAVGRAGYDTAPKPGKPPGQMVGAVSICGAKGLEPLTGGSYCRHGCRQDCRRISSRGGVIALIEFLGDPYLDERLTSDTESGRLPVEFGDHPCREIDVHTPVFLTGAPCPSRIQSGRHVLAGVKPLVEFLSLHKVPPRSLDGRTKMIPDVFVSIGHYRRPNAAANLTDHHPPRLICHAGTSDHTEAARG